MTLTNTFLGHAAGADPGQKPDAENSTAIGAGAYTTKDDQVVIGNAEVTETVTRGEIIVESERGLRIWPDIDNYFAMGAGPTTKPYDTGAGSPAGNHGFGLRTLGALTGGITNTGFGFEALRDLTTGIDNTAFGAEALASQISGIGSTAVGKWALRHATTPSSNTGLGDTALEFTTTGASNTAVGYGSGYKNTTGENNTFVGVYAGGAQGAGPSDRSTYSKSVAVGSETLNFNLTGEENTVIGYRSGHVLTSNGNTSVGFESIRFVTTGDLNVAVGHRSGSSLTTGVANTFIGASSGEGGGQVESVSNSTAIGYQAVTTADNQVVIGNESVVQTVLRGRIGIGIGTSTPVGNLQVQGTTGAETAIFTRTHSADAMVHAARVRAIKATDMGDNFGVSIGFTVEDDAGVANPVATVGAIRRGADNTGELQLRPFTAGVLDEGMVVRGRKAVIGWDSAPPAGGSHAVGLGLSNVESFGLYFGVGAPSLSAAKGSLYMRTDGSGTNDRMYVNTDGGTTWTYVVTGI